MEVCHIFQWETEKKWTVMWVPTLVTSWCEYGTLRNATFSFLFSLNEAISLCLIMIENVLISYKHHRALKYYYLIQNEKAWRNNMPPHLPISHINLVLWKYKFYLRYIFTQNTFRDPISHDLNISKGQILKYILSF